MKVVVTGATGNVGTQVLDVLAADPKVDEVVGLARRPTDRGWPKTEVRTVDVVADELGPHFEGADAVVHLAWLFHPTRGPEVTWDVNVGGATRVMDACARAKVPTLVVASSVGAYSPGRGKVVGETWPTASLPTAAYGREKAYVERLLDVFERDHPEVRTVRMRPGFIFQRSSGTQQRRLFGGPFVPASLLRLPRIPIFPFPHGLRFQALHAADAARAYHLALMTDVRGAFNLAAEPVIDAAAIGTVLGGHPVDVPARAARAALGAAWLSRLVPASPPLFDLVMSLPQMRTDRARRELGWTPRFSSLEALREGLGGMAHGEGGGTAPLAADSAAERAGEVVSGVGARDRP